MLHPQVDLKEQGQLQCQDELIVCCGRKKCLRHMFLFDELILFSKTKKVDGGHDVYMYKQSFKVTHPAQSTGIRRDLSICVVSCGSLGELWKPQIQGCEEPFVLSSSESHFGGWKTNVSSVSDFISDFSKGEHGRRPSPGWSWGQPTSPSLTEALRVWLLGGAHTHDAYLTGLRNTSGGPVTPSSV